MANNTTPAKQPQKDDTSTDNPATTKEHTSFIPSPSLKVSWLPILVVLVTVALSLYALTVRTCEGSLSLKGWGLEYQLTKKGSCSPTSELSQE